MKIGVVNKSSAVNRFVLHILQRNITHLAVTTRKTNIKFGILKGGTGKEPENACFKFPTPKKLIIQLPASNVWKNASHTIFN